MKLWLGRSFRMWFREQELTLLRVGEERQRVAGSTFGSVDGHDFGQEIGVWDRICAL